MWWEGGCDVIFHITEGGGRVRTNFFCFGGGVLSKFLLDKSSFSVPPPDNYCTVPYDHNSSQTICITLNKTVLKGYVRAISLKSKTLSVTAHHLNSNYNGPEVCC